MHDLGSHRDRRNGIRAAVLACDKQIGHAVESLKETAEKIGKRKSQKVSKYTSPGQIMLLHLLSSYLPRSL